VSNAYNFKKVVELYTNCSECKLKFSKEPGFYFGAMYVSYAIGIAIFIASYTANWILGLDTSLLHILLFVGTVLLIGTPYLFHLSKIIWANLFIHFKVKK
jgi:hypothetical protein